jgi:2-oxoglutarate/2-oxoacid ferredoxin oxidoreductase subunit beta
MSSPADTQTGTATEGTPAKRAPKDYRGRLKPVWCPGCGNYGVLNALVQALSDLEIDPDNLALVSGIGCSSRLPGFVQGYGFHGVHGRGLPVAIGVKLGNPRLTVLMVGGDGDGLSIGAGHFPHAARRNIDITYMMLDNRIYGLTKGQSSPTTPTGYGTKSSPLGVVESPMNPAGLALCYGATFVARGYSAHMPQLRTLIVEAIRHPGFSLLQVLSPCVTFGKGSGYDFFNERIQPLPEDYAANDPGQALAHSVDLQTIRTGILYRGKQPEFVDVMRGIGGARGRELDDTAPAIDTEALVRRFS